MKKAKPEIPNGKKIKGYVITPNGKVYSPYGKEVSVTNDRFTFRYDGQNHIYKLSRLYYELYSGKKLSSKEIIKFKDGNPKNLSLDNLIVKTVKQLHVDLDLDEKCRKFSPEEVQAILDEYKPEVREHRLTLGLPSHASLAYKYGCGKSTIQKIVTGTYYQGVKKKK